MPISEGACPLPHRAGHWAKKCNGKFIYLGPVELRDVLAEMTDAELETLTRLVAATKAGRIAKPAATESGRGTSWLPNWGEW